MTCISFSLACKCNEKGSETSQCNDAGMCTCKANTQGTKCDSCIDNHFGFPDCKDCKCDKTGSTSLKCSSNGSCVLACPKGWFPLPSTKGDKCYRISSSNLNYADAIAHCKSLSSKSSSSLVRSKLAEPVDLIESKAIFEATKKITWIGINDLQVENE